MVAGEDGLAAELIMEQELGNVYNLLSIRSVNGREGSTEVIFKKTAV